MGGLYVHITHIKKQVYDTISLTHGQVETSRTEQKQELKEAWCSYMFQIPPFPLVKLIVLLYFASFVLWRCTLSMFFSNSYCLLLASYNCFQEVLAR